MHLRADTKEIASIEPGCFRIVFLEVLPPLSNFSCQIRMIFQSPLQVPHPILLILTCMTISLSLGHSLTGKL